MGVVKRMRIEIPMGSLVLIYGTTSKEGIAFAKKHFRDTEILASDVFQGEKEEIEAFYSAVKKRCVVGMLTVIDATPLNQAEQKQLISIAQQHHMQTVGIVLGNKRQKEQSDFSFFDQLHSAEAIDQVTISRVPLPMDRTEEKGPFDIIGDIHGCFDELCILLGKLGYQIQRQIEGENITYQVHHPDGRKVIFLGDLVDRGPKSPCVLQLVMDMVEAGTAQCVMGNHDYRLYRVLDGQNVPIQHGLEQTLEQIKHCSPEWLDRVQRFLQTLAHHYVFDSGHLVVAHAGLIEPYHGRHSEAVRQFALFGDPTGERDQYGFPIRRNWAKDYRGQAMVIYGHTPVQTPIFQNRTVNIDTGCVFGGHLTAFRYPEEECISVPSRRNYADLGRPFFTKDDFLEQPIISIQENKKERM